MKPDNQSKRWAVWPKGPHTPLSSLNGQLNIVLACPHTLYSHINTGTGKHNTKHSRTRLGKDCCTKPTGKGADGGNVGDTLGLGSIYFFRSS